MIITRLCVLLVVLATSLQAASSKYLNLSRSETKIETHGLSFKNFYKTESLQVQPLRASSFTRTNSYGEASKVEVYKFDELWKRDQYVASFTNEAVFVNIYALKFLKPDCKSTFNFKGTNYVDKVEYKQNAQTLESWTPEQQLQWFKAFTDKTATLEDRFKTSSMHYTQKWLNHDQDHRHYDFILTAKDKRCFYVNIELLSGEQKANDKIINSFLRYFKIGVMKQLKASNQSKTAQHKGDRSAKFQATVDRVIQAVSAMQGWWYAETQNYIVKSNLDNRSRVLAKKLQERVEVMRKAYERFLPPNHPIDEVSVMTIPDTHATYLEYIGDPSMEWTGGLWTPSRKELILSTLIKTSRGKPNEDWMFNVLHHEAFHQYIHYALDETRTPLWFNEGHAELFAASKVRGDKVTLIEDTRAIKKLAPKIKSKSLNLKKHLYCDHEAYYADKELNYPLGWAVCYFLRKAGPLYKEKGYDKVIDRVIAALRQGKSPDAATDAGFEGIDFEQFTADFYAFWPDKRTRSKALRTIIVPKKVSK